MDRAVLIRNERGDISMHWTLLVDDSAPVYFNSLKEALIYIEELPVGVPIVRGRA